VQPLVALSSTEAELIAVDEASRELRFLEKLLADFGIAAPRPTDGHWSRQFEHM
jgi:hypothetical protein